MGRHSTIPTLYDDALQLSITKLKEWNYLIRGQCKSGVLAWSRNGNKTGSISIRVNMESDTPFVDLDYRFNDKPRQYRVFLQSAPSNLGKGEMWFFECPETGKRCRKLYSVDGYFRHREAFRGCLYGSQTRSKKWRDMERLYGAYFDRERLYEQLYKKHFKKTYAGKPTKKYRELMRKLKIADGVPIGTIERLLASGC